MELADELLRNRHKALVFSQFLGHLEKVREALDARGVRYQYIDGGVPAQARAERVAAFQAGDGDLFLISLKAGGVGLNLTAADYVSISIRGGTRLSRIRHPIARTALARAAR